MDCLPDAEREALAENAHLLAPAAGEMHLDAIELAVVERMMLERGDVEIRAELAIDAHQQIAVELRSHALSIVVSGVKQFRIFDEINADDERSVVPEHPPRGPEKCRDFVRLEIADGGPRKEPEPRSGSHGRRQFEGVIEVGRYRQHLKVREI